MLSRLTCSTLGSMLFVSPLLSLVLLWPELAGEEEDDDEEEDDNDDAEEEEDDNDDDGYVETIAERV